jgi:hypothetical protein
MSWAFDVRRLFARCASRRQRGLMPEAHLRHFGRRVLFLHIPKTAGTSLSRFLYHQFPAQACLVDPHPASIDKGEFDRWAVRPRSEQSGHPEPRHRPQPRPIGPGAAAALTGARRKPRPFVCRGRAGIKSPPPAHCQARASCARRRVRGALASQRKLVGSERSRRARNTARRVRP